MTRTTWSEPGDRFDRNLEGGQTPVRGIKGESKIHLCPNCGSENTHHTAVDVYARLREDADGHHARVDRTGVKVDTDISGNPSRRRDGIKINLWCEECNFIHDLEISQHKGNTIISIENIRPDTIINKISGCRDCNHLVMDKWNGDYCDHIDAPKNCHVDRDANLPGWCPLSQPQPGGE